MGSPQQMPLWHNVLFRNAQGLTYCSPLLVRKIVLIVSPQVLVKGQWKDTLSCL